MLLAGDAASSITLSSRCAVRVPLSASSQGLRSPETSISEVSALAGVAELKPNLTGEETLGDAVADVLFDTRGRPGSGEVGFESMWRLV
jgi:hypothetical protein